MVDERTLELINAELDGELTAPEREELAQRFLAAPQAHALQHDLHKIADSLRRLQPLPVPAGLRESLRGRHAPIAPAVSRRRPARFRLPALALAASIVFAVVGYTLLGNPTPGLEPEQLVATMGHDSAPTALSKHSLVAPGLAGQVTILHSGQTWQLVFDLQTPEPVTVSLAYEASALRLKGYALGDISASGLPDLQLVPGSARFVSHGRQHLVFLVEADRADSVQIRFEASGHLLKELVLDVPASGKPR